MPKKLLLISAISLFVLVNTATPVSAEPPRRYYDWSATLDTSNPQVLGLQAFAQEASPSAAPTPQPQKAPEDYSHFNHYAFGSNIAPDSPFHFLKTFQENVRLAFTTDPVKKEELRLEIAGERLGEIKTLADNNKTKSLPSITSSYEKTLETIENKLTDLPNKDSDQVKELFAKVEEETAKHNIILEDAATKVPDQARDSIEKALDKNTESIDKVADLNGRPAVPPDVVARLQALKSQGLLTQEETTKIIGLTSRVEARSELEKLAKEGVVPPSDLVRMNENVKSLYPQRFYEIHETKRFEELKRLETDKPDEGTLARIREFAKTYKPGETVPTDIRKYWAPVIRLEELQNTLRPDLINANLYQNRPEEAARLKEVIEQFKPRPEDLAYINKYIQNNSMQPTDLPPEYQRMYNLAKSYGAQCGANMKWIKSPDGNSGWCAPQDFNESANQLNVTGVSSSNTCKGNFVSAKGNNGACSVFPSDCIPTGWTKVPTCVGTPGDTNRITGQKTIDCPSNSHYVSVSYESSGGYCIPNYSSTSRGGPNEPGYISCPAGYHRNYPGGPCLQDYNPSGSTYSLPPLTNTPGNYPSPIYTYGGRCAPGYNWVPEPINPNGGYCAPNNYQYNTYNTRPTAISPMPGNGLPNTEMGNCKTPGECYDWCSANPGKCPGFNPNSSRPSDNNYQNPAGYYPTGSQPNSSWNTRDSWNTRENQESGCKSGGGTCSWNGDMCNCQGYKSPTYTTPTYSTPSGYGSCPSGMRWNGSYCVSEASPTNFSSSSSMNYNSRESQESGCRSGGGTCSWNGDMCNCQGYKSPAPTYSNSYSSPSSSSNYYPSSPSSPSSSSSSNPPPPPSSSSENTSPPPSSSSNSNPPPSSDAPSSSSPPQ